MELTSGFLEIMETWWADAFDMTFGRITDVHIEIPYFMTHFKSSFFFKFSSVYFIIEQVDVWIYSTEEF